MVRQLERRSDAWARDTAAASSEQDQPDRFVLTGDALRYVKKLWPQSDVLEKLDAIKDRVFEDHQSFKDEVELLAGDPPLTEKQISTLLMIARPIPMRKVSMDAAHRSRSVPEERRQLRMARSWLEETKKPPTRMARPAS